MVVVMAVIAAGGGRIPCPGYKRHPLSSRRPPVLMMDPVEHRDGDDPSTFAVKRLAFLDATISCWRSIAFSASSSSRLRRRSSTNPITIGDGRSAPRATARRLVTA